MAKVIEKTEAYVAQDGSLHPTEEAVRFHNLGLELINLFGYKGGLYDSVHSHWSARDRVLENIDKFLEVLNAYKGR